MAKNDINLATIKKRSFVPVFSTVSVVLLSLIFSLYNYNKYFINKNYMNGIEKKLANLEKKFSKKSNMTFEKVDEEAIRKEVYIINGFIEKKNFSWCGLLTDLETCLPEGVHLTQISPEFSGSGVNITGIARSMEEVLTTVNKMSAGKFSDVFLKKHSKNDKENKVSFNITAKYRFSE